MANKDYTYQQILNDTTGKLGYKQETSPVFSAGVKTMQQYLILIGYDIDDDGKFGPKCKKAVEDFQTECNLGVDGSAGAKTLKQLEKARVSDYFKTYGKPITAQQWGRDYITGGNVDDKDLLSRVIWVEERDVTAQPAVAKVIKNRTTHSDLMAPGSASKWARVIGCANQYDSAVNAQAYAPIRGDSSKSDGVSTAWKNAVDLAKKLVAGTAFTVNKAYYVNPSTGKVDTTASKMKAIDTQLYQVGRVSFLSYMSKYVCTDCYTYAKSLDSGYVNGFCNTKVQFTRDYTR